MRLARYPHRANPSHPKAKTLELFGRKGRDGLPQPFHLYSMQQAIEEDFILRDALDRAGLAAKNAVEVEVGPPKPYEVILESIEAGSRAEYRRSIGRPDDSDSEWTFPMQSEP